MDDHEFAASEVAEAFNDYLDYSTGILELTGVIYRAFDSVSKNRELASVREPFGHYAQQVIAAIETNKRDGYPVLHPMVLSASWGAFETMVADVCKAMLRLQPQLFDSEGFKKVKLPATALALDGSERVDLAVDLAFNTQSDIRDTGTGKFEKQLRMVELDGEVPSDLAKNISEANAVRNVFLHNGGRVDRRFQQRCPHSSLSVGDKVTINIETTAEYVIGLQTYAIVILNRYRQKHGLTPIQCYSGPASPFTTSFNALFPDAVPVETLG